MTNNILIKCVKNDKGIAVVLMAIMIFVLVGFLGLAVDAGYMYVVKGELQNAADAGALAGAGSLYPANPNWNWASGQTNSTALVQQNKAAAVNLVDAQVEAGYWNIKQVPSGIQPQGTVPKGKCTSAGTACTKSNDCPPSDSCIMQDLPAVRVTVSRSTGNNGGPVRTFFAHVLGWDFVSIPASAVAALKSPSTIGKGGLLPVAIAQCFADDKTIINGQSAPFYIYSDYHAPPCDTGQWTTFKVKSNKVPTIQELLANGNPDPISVGDEIWIEPGTKTALYKDVPTNVDVLLPIVEGSDLSTHDWNKVVGFIPFHIISAEGGSSKYIYGYFNGPFQTNLGSGAGPNYNAYTPPLLVN